MVPASHALCRGNCCQRGVAANHSPMRDMLTYDVFHMKVSLSLKKGLEGLLCQNASVAVDGQSFGSGKPILW